MPTFSVDFSESESFEPLPVGQYDVTILEAIPGESQGGNPKVDIVLEVVGNADPDLDGRRLFHTFVVGGDTTQRGVRLSLGQTQEAFEVLFGSGDGGEFDTDSFVGIGATVKVGQRVWAESKGGDGKVRNRITAFLSGSGGAEASAGAADMFLD